MFLSLLFRGASGYTLLHGTREVGSFSGSVLRFYPFSTEAEAIRAADAGCYALVHWLGSRADTRSLGTPPLGDAASGDSASRWMGPGGVPVARLSYHPSGSLVETHRDATHARPVYAVEFVLPEGVYAAVALQPAQRIHEAIRELAADAMPATPASVTSDAVDEIGSAPAHSTRNAWTSEE